QQLRIGSKIGRVWRYIGLRLYVTIAEFAPLVLHPTKEGFLGIPKSSSPPKESMQSGGEVVILEFFRFLNSHCPRAQACREHDQGRVHEHHSGHRSGQIQECRLCLRPGWPRPGSRRNRLHHFRDDPGGIGAALDCNREIKAHGAVNGQQSRVRLATPKEEKKSSPKTLRALTKEDIQRFGSTLKSSPIP